MEENNNFFLLCIIYYLLWINSDCECSSIDSDIMWWFWLIIGWLFMFDYCLLEIRFMFGFVVGRDIWLL